MIRVLNECKSKPLALKESPPVPTPSSTALQPVSLPKAKGIQRNIEVEDDPACLGLNLAMSAQPRLAVMGLNQTHYSSIYTLLSLLLAPEEDGEEEGVYSGLVNGAGQPKSLTEPKPCS